MTTMPPFGLPAGSARQAAASKPSAAFNLIHCPMWPSEVRWKNRPRRSASPVLRLSRSRVGRATPRQSRPALRQHDPPADQRQRDEMVRRKRLAEQSDGQERAEDRHQIDEHAGPPGPDQLDAAHEQHLREKGRPQRRIDENRKTPGARPDEAALPDLPEKRGNRGNE